MSMTDGPHNPLIQYCPCCGCALNQSFSLVDQIWTGIDTISICWCSNCLWHGEIIEVKRVTAYELVED